MRRGDVCLDEEWLLAGLLDESADHLGKLLRIGSHRVPRIEGKLPRRAHVQLLGDGPEEAGVAKHLVQRPDILMDTNFVEGLACAREFRIGFRQLRSHCIAPFAVGVGKHPGEQ